MGASLSSNVDNMMTSVYNDSTETTNIVNTNKNNNAQAASLDGCTMVAKGSVTIQNSIQQSQNIMQQSTVSNSMINTDNVNQNLLQNAQAKVSDWGIGLASSNNTSNQVASITNSTSSAINVSNSNVNNSFNSINCTDSTIIAGGDFTLNNNSDQTLIADQVANASALSNITNNVTQAASQTAVSTVSGVNLVGLIVAVIVLIIIIAIVLQILKSKASNYKNLSETISNSSAAESNASIQGGKIYMLSPIELKLYCWCAIFVIILSVIGGLGLAQRDQLRCDFDSQCQSENFWFNAKSATCSCNGRDECSTHVEQKSLLELVAPPLFMCNSVEPDAGFGDSNEVNGLYPGSLQYMMVQKVLSGANRESAMRNNNGFNCGVFSQLLNMAENGIVGTANIINFINALVTYMQRQILTLGTNGKPLINTPNLSTSLNNWCAARIVQNLLPIQPAFAAPDTAYLCSQANTGECVDTIQNTTYKSTMTCPKSKTSNLKKARMLRSVAATKSRRRKNNRKNQKQLSSYEASKIRLASGLQRGIAMKREQQLEKRRQQHKKMAKRMFAQKPQKTGLAARQLRRKGMRPIEKRRQRPGKTGLATIDCSLSGIPAPGDSYSGSIQYSTPAFNSQGNNNPSGFNLFADVCYKSVNGRMVFKTPNSCPSDTCASYPSDGSSMVIRIDVIDGGAGYSDDTTCSIVGTNNNNSASAQVYVDSGVIKGIRVTNGGSGFGTAPTITFNQDGSPTKTATARAVIGTICVDKDDNSKQCTQRCGNGSDGWMTMPKAQGQVIGGGNTCSETGINASTMDGVFFKNGLWMKGKDSGDNTYSKCFVGAGTMQVATAPTRTRTRFLILNAIQPKLILTPVQEKASVSSGPLTTSSKPMFPLGWQTTLATLGETLLNPLPWACHWNKMIQRKCFTRT